MANLRLVTDVQDLAEQERSSYRLRIVESGGEYRDEIELWDENVGQWIGVAPGLGEGMAADLWCWCCEADKGERKLSAIRADYRRLFCELKRETRNWLRQQRLQYLSQHVPPEYQQRVIPEKHADFNADAFRQVMEWVPGLDGPRPGLVCFGTTGRGKTRSVYARLTELYLENGLKFIEIAADRMTDCIVKRIRDSSLDEQKSDWMNVDLLFIDDLHNARWTPRCSTELLSVVKHRVDHGRWIVITTQLIGDDLADKIATESGDMQQAQAIIRRLREKCRPVDFDNF